MAKSRCHLLIKISHVIVTNFNFANMSFNAIHKNKVLAKISEFTVSRGVLDNKCFGAALQHFGSLSQSFHICLPTPYTCTNQYFLSSFYSVNGFVRTSLLKQLDPPGPIASRGRSVPVFLRKHIITCDFPVGRGI